MAHSSGKPRRGLRPAWRAALRHRGSGRRADPACDCGLRVQAYPTGRRPVGGAGPAGGLAAPACNVLEKQVVFGATSRLREQIKNTVKMIDGRLLRRAQQLRHRDDRRRRPGHGKGGARPGLSRPGDRHAGFRGTSHEGYELFLNGVLAQLGCGTGRRTRPRWSILGIVPRQDVFWQGELEEWSRLLAGIGLRANPVFGPAGGIDGLRDLTRAGLTLVCRRGAPGWPRTGTGFGVPWVDTGGLPVGAAASGSAARAARPASAGGAGEAFIAAETRREDHYPQRLADAVFPARTAARVRAGRRQLPGSRLAGS